MDVIVARNRSKCVPAAPLLDILERNNVSYLSLGSANRAALYRARRSGYLTYEVADRILVRIGAGPLPAVYPIGECRY